VQLDQLRVEGDIDGTQYARHEVFGQDVEIIVQLTGGGSETIRSKIDYAGAIVESPDESTLEYPIRATINNRRVNGNRWLITPGLNASIRLTGGAGLRFSQADRELPAVTHGKASSSRPALR
jgi:hypothetical protein